MSREIIYESGVFKNKTRNKFDSIFEMVNGNGVTIDGVELKDGGGTFSDDINISGTTTPISASFNGDSLFYKISRTDADVDGFFGVTDTGLFIISRGIADNTERKGISFINGNNKDFEINTYGYAKFSGGIGIGVTPTRPLDIATFDTDGNHIRLREDTNGIAKIQMTDNIASVERSSIIFKNGDITTNGIINMPEQSSVGVYSSSNQTITNQYDPIILSGENIDVQNEWNTSSGYFTPTKSGNYLFNIGVSGSSMTGYLAVYDDTNTLVGYITAVIGSSGGAGCSVLPLTAGVSYKITSNNAGGWTINNVFLSITKVN